MSFAARGKRFSVNDFAFKLLLRQSFQVDFRRRFFYKFSRDFFVFRNIFFLSFLVQTLKINIFISGRSSYIWNMIWTISKFKKKSEENVRANTSRANPRGWRFRNFEIFTGFAEAKIVVACTQRHGSSEIFTSVQKCQMFILSSRDLKVIDDNFLEVLMRHFVTKLFLEALKTFQSLQ